MVERCLQRVGGILGNSLEWSGRFRLSLIRAGTRGAGNSISSAFHDLSIYATVRDRGQIGKWGGRSRLDLGEDLHTSLSSGLNEGRIEIVTTAARLDGPMLHRGKSAGTYNGRQRESLSFVYSTSRSKE